MNTFKIFKNYGCLSREKRAVYTFGVPVETATCYDEIEFEVPEGWTLCKNYMDETIIEAPSGKCYNINDVICGNERAFLIEPTLEDNPHRYPLKKV